MTTPSTPPPDDDMLYAQWEALMEDAQEADPLSAQALYQQCEQLAKQTTEPEELLILTWHQQALAYYQTTHIEEGDRTIQAAAQLARQTYRDDPHQLVLILNPFTTGCLHAQRYHVAKDWTEEALTLSRDLAVQEPKLLFDALYGHATVLAHRQDGLFHAQIDTLLQEALALFPRVPDIDPSVQIVLRLNQAANHIADKRWLKAQPILERLLPEIRREAPELEGLCLEHLATCYRQQGDTAKFQETTARTLHLMHQDQDPDRGLVILNRGLEALTNEAYEDAHATLTQALDALQRDDRAYDARFAKALSARCQASFHLRHYADARRDGERAIALFRELLPHGDPNRLQALANLGFVLMQAPDGSAFDTNHAQLIEELLHPTAYPKGTALDTLRAYHEDLLAFETKERADEFLSILKVYVSHQWTIPS